MTTPKTYGKINYVPHRHTPAPSPHNFHLPAISEFNDPRILPLHDLRPLPTLSQLPDAKDHASLSTHNFTALVHPSALHSAPYSYSSWKDPALLSQIYVPETEELVKRITGAKTVVTEALLLRSVLWTEEDGLATHAGHGTNSQQQEKKKDPEDAASTAFPQFIGFSPLSGGASPAPKPHQDYTPSGARTHIRHYHPSLTTAASAIIAAEDAHGRGEPDSPPPRWALYSIWRPLKRVRRDPLALGDARTFCEADYVPVVVRTPSLGSTGGGEVHECEAWVARAGAGEGHRWWWVSGQGVEEVLVIGLFDSAGEGKGAGGAMHCSVGLEGVVGEEEVEARESLEVRCLAVW
jgi:hypothetical protein